MTRKLLNDLFTGFKFRWHNEIYLITNITSANDELKIVTLTATDLDNFQDYAFSMTYQEWDIALSEFQEENNRVK